MDLREMAQFHRREIDKIFQKYSINAEIKSITRSARLVTYAIKLSNATNLTKSLSLSEEIALATNSSSVTCRRVGGLVRYEISLPESLWRKTNFSEFSQNMQIAVGSANEPHTFAEDSAILVAGVQGSGKSEMVRTILTAMLKAHKPEDVKIALIDTHKSIEGFNDVAHFMTNEPISSPKDITSVLALFENELHHRKDLGEIAVKNGDYPLMVLVIDECADVKVLGFYKHINVENQATVLNLIKEGRKFKIKVILGTQKPSEDNMPGIFSLLYTRYIGLTSNAAMSNLLTANAGIQAHYLTGKGDFYYINKGHVERIFVGMVTNQDLINLPKDNTPKILPSVPTNTLNGYSLGEYLLYGIDKKLPKGLKSDYEKLLNDFNKYLNEHGLSIEGDNNEIE